MNSVNYLTLGFPYLLLLSLQPSSSPAKASRDVLVMLQTATASRAKVKKASMLDTLSHHSLDVCCLVITSPSTTGPRVDSVIEKASPALVLVKTQGGFGLSGSLSTLPSSRIRTSTLLTQFWAVSLESADVSSGRLSFVRVQVLSGLYSSISLKSLSVSGPKSF